MQVFTHYLFCVLLKTVVNGFGLMGPGACASLPAGRGNTSWDCCTDLQDISSCVVAAAAAVHL
jgi:hypothetical protein